MIKPLCSALLLCLFVVFARAQESEPDFTQSMRPQFHFTAPANWIGNPAATVYSDGLYHLFYEYSPVGNTAIYTNMGHAVSKDLLHWEVKPIAVVPDNDTRDLYKCTIRSGSALVDEQNVLGKQAGGSPTLVIFYTSYDCGIRMAYSSDNGENWTKYGSNPIIPYKADENARDPKVFWYEPGKCFVMVLARNPEDGDIGDGFSFYTSTNLTDWSYQSHIVGPKGRPDLFELPVNGHPDEEQWVLTDSIGAYVIGDFDGKSFTALTSLMKTDYGTFKGGSSWIVPGEDGTQRVIQIGSISEKELAEMPFAGQMSIPVELSLHKYPEGLRLVKEPVKELGQLQDKSFNISEKNILPGLDKNPVKRLKGDCFRFKGTFDLKTVSSFGYVIRAAKGQNGVEIRYDATRNLLSCLGKSASLMPEDGKIKLDVLVDRSSVEIFANDGKVVLSGQYSSTGIGDEYILYNTGGELFIDNLDVYPMISVYPKK
ncbi:glycoside hydrolase family 32 protein [Mangrovibacterium diazotrophicum]|uniref:Fructan beta-fructosidase n=1 Tax=Mangrovibacterium diazotrophicum TaxID=1261403 RepID=A0A419W9M8_9BACT|nr:glycoside hydrolase family 32 protein [Mangrovibacterium diazotrophicum]RKD92181.1 fructan beta-fructosidase [Mangrovibacterium diazotrophicum]